VTLSAAGLATLLADSARAAVPTALAGDTVRAALATAAGHAAAVPVRAAALAAAVLKGAAWGKGALAVILVLLLGAAVAGALAGQTGAQDLPPDRRAEVAPPRVQPQEPGPQPKKVPQPEPLLKRYLYKDLHVEAGFTPVKTEAVLGEPLPVTFLVKNLGRKELGYWFGGDYRGTGRHDRFKIEARDASGKLLRDPKADANGHVLNMLALKHGVTYVRRSQEEYAAQMKEKQLQALRRKARQLGLEIVEKPSGSVPTAAAASGPG
jgi:hypothetical protein